MNPVRQLHRAIDAIEAQMILRMIKTWRGRYTLERELEALPRNDSELGYRTPDIGGEA